MTIVSDEEVRKLFADAPLPADGNNVHPACSYLQVDSHYYGSLYTVAALDGQTREHICECLMEVADDSKTSCILCVGHNKGWEEAASAFAGKVVKLKTASAALLQCAANSWKDVLTHDSTHWQLVGVLSPSDP